MAYQPTHYHGSKGLQRIEDMHPSHIRRSADKMERDGPTELSAEDHADAVAHMRSVAERKEAEFEAANPDYVKKADRK